VRRMLGRLWAETGASENTSVVILIAMGCIAGLAVLTDLGYHLYQYFHAVGQCLNGC
jgi:hypothetical protein